LAARLFSESPSRIIISFEEAALGQVEEIAARSACPLTIMGRTGGERLSIKADGEEVVDLSVAELEAAWRGALSSKLRAEVVTA
jgi:phosphoribosylformylglycinamidine synthase